MLEKKFLIGGKLEAALKSFIQPPSLEELKTQELLEKKKMAAPCPSIDTTSSGYAACSCISAFGNIIPPPTPCSTTNNGKRVQHLETNSSA
jgi:hypothetical protein